MSAARISTAMVYANGLNAVQHRQADLSKLQQQLATGRRILTPSDDPAGAVQVLKFRDQMAALEQYGRNATLARPRLELEETVLSGMTDVLQRVRELTVQAANATQTNESRAAIAGELRQLSASLVDLANTRDAGGEYLFAGHRTDQRPFTRGADGDVSFHGDGGQRRVAISPDRSVAVGDSGDTFMSVPRGNGVFVVTPDSGNAGTARVSTTAASAVADPGASYTIAFGGDGTWVVRDSADTVIADGLYAAGTAIEFEGRRIVIDGDPADGDLFAVTPAGRDSLFAIVDRLADTLSQPRSTPAQVAALQHQTGTALEDADQALTRLQSLRTGVGARLAAIDDQQRLHEDVKLQLQTALSGIEDLDYAAAISEFSLQQVALDAARMTYAQFSRLSLFDYLK